VMGDVLLRAPDRIVLVEDAEQFLPVVGPADERHRFERRDVAAIDNALDIAVCSSISESFPNAIGEAMACGVPCVVTDVGDCGYLVGETGYVVPPRNARALADAIVRMGELPEGDRTAMGANARRRVIAKFSMHSVVQQFAELYELCGRR